MKQENYRKPLKSYDEFYSGWTAETLSVLNDTKRKLIYNDYLVRHVVFNRDNFQCQVENCNFLDSPITLHHYKHQENGGKTTVRNCVTVCRAHQDLYHRCKGAIKFRKVPVLPNHIKGMTQAHERFVNGKPEQIENFIAKDELRKYKILRKENKEFHHIHLSMVQILILFLFLENFTQYECIA